MPAYNAEKTLHLALNEIPKDWVDDIILVDDASQGPHGRGRARDLRVFTS